MLLKVISTKVIVSLGFHMQGEFHINAFKVRTKGNLRGINVRTGNLRGIDDGNTGNLSSESALQIQSEIASTTKTNTGCSGDDIGCSTENSGNDLPKDGINNSNDLPKNKNVITNPSEGGNMSNNHSEDGNSGNIGKTLSEDGNIGNDLLESNMKMTLSAVSVQLLEGLDLVEHLGLGESLRKSGNYDTCLLIFASVITLLGFFRCAFHCYNSYNPHPREEEMSGMPDWSSIIPNVYEAICSCNCWNWITLCEWKTWHTLYKWTMITCGMRPEDCKSADEKIKQYYSLSGSPDNIASLCSLDPTFACQYSCCLDVLFLWCGRVVCRSDTFKCTCWNFPCYLGWVCSYVAMLFSGVYRNSIYRIMCCCCNGCDVPKSDDYNGERQKTCLEEDASNDACCASMSFSQVASSAQNCFENMCRRCTDDESETDDDNEADSNPCCGCDLLNKIKQHRRIILFWSCSFVQIVALFCAGWVTSMADFTFGATYFYIIGMVIWKICGVLSIVVACNLMCLFAVCGCCWSASYTWIKN